MCLLDNYEDDMIDDSDLVEISQLSMKICFVFKQDLTDNQILSLKRCFPDVEPQDSIKRFFLRKEKYVDWEFLEKEIPWDLANLLSYVECSNFSNRMPVLLFQSDTLISRSKLIEQIYFEFGKRRFVDNGEVLLGEILNPVWFHHLLKRRLLDICSAEMIASHFYLNPIVIMPNNRSDLGPGSMKAGLSRINMKDIPTSFSNAKKILVVDESQKVKMYTITHNLETLSGILDINTWLEKSSAFDILIRSENDNSDHHIICIVQSNFVYGIYQPRILAFN